MDESGPGEPAMVSTVGTAGNTRYGITLFPLPTDPSVARCPRSTTRDVNKIRGVGYVIIDDAAEVDSNVTTPHQCGLPQRYFRGDVTYVPYSSKRSLGST